jgi:predicted ATPase/DNA-binding SARP family transcriptional activator
MLGGLRLIPPRLGVDSAITYFSTRKTGLLLAYLAYHREREVHSRDVLADLLWPDSNSEKARNTLRVSLNRLRKVFLKKGYDPDSFLHVDNFSIGLKQDCVITDVAYFEKALHSAAEASTLEERTDSLCEAVELYRGELLRDYDESWIEPQARRLEGLFHGALRELLALLEESGEVTRALRYAYHAVGVTPWREEAHRELLRLYIAQGQRDTARAHYEHYCQALQRNFGSLPDETIQSLMEPLLKSRADTDARLTIGDSPKNGRASTSKGIEFNSTLEQSKRSEAKSGNRPTAVQAGTVQAGAAFWVGNSVTFLLLDNLPWRNEKSASERHNYALLRELIVQHGGHEFGERRGESIWAIFRSATDALSCALAVRQSTAGTFYEDCRMALDTSDGGLGADSWDNLSKPREEQQNDSSNHHLSAGADGARIKRVALDRTLSILQAGHAGQTLCSEVTGALLRRSLEADVALDDLGVYRLHDAPVPERIYQISYHALQSRSFPPLLASPLHSSELPSSITTFFGRQHDLKKLETWLAPAPVKEGQSSLESQRAMRSHARLVTLTGCGGCGKTRLALEVARRLQAPYHQAVWFVPLSGVRDPELIIHAVIDALRLPGAPGLDPWLQVANELGQRPSLLVMDNFEQLHAGGVDVVKRLLDQIPTLSCLVTSRRTLMIKGEQEWPVASLPIPPLMPQSAAEAENRKRRRQIRASESVMLFVDRARLARPSFELTPPYMDAVAQLCKLLDGLPLAIELVASHAHGLTPPQILALLEPYTEKEFEPKDSAFDSLDLFHDERPGTPERHRSLRAAIQWSYDLLDPPLQKFFGRLWVFKGGWTPEAAQLVASSEKEISYINSTTNGHGVDALNKVSVGEGSFENFVAGITFEHLLQLQERSMILAEEQGTAIRFSLLDMLRRFAKEQLSAEECRLLEARHAAYFRYLAECAADELMGGGRDEWLRRLDPEIDNLRAALAWTLRYQPSHCLQMAGALWRFWEARGLFAEGRDWFERAFAACASISHDETAALTEVTEAEIAANTSPLSPAKTLVTPTSSVKTQLPLSLPLYLRALNGAGRLAWYRADFAAARRLLGECLAIVRLQNASGPINSPNNSSPEQRHGVANALHSLGLVAMCQGDGSARAMVEEGLALVRADGDRRVIKDFMLGLALVKFYMADSSTADNSVRELLGEALEISRELDDRRGIAFALNNLGMVEGMEKNYDAARDYHESSLPLLREMGDRWSTARALAGLARVAWFQGDIEAARAYYRENLMILRDLGSVWELVYTLEGFAWLALHEGKPQRAARLLGASDALREAAGHILFPVARAYYEECVSRTRAALSSEGESEGKPAFESLWRRGRLLSRAEAIAEALDK